MKEHERKEIERLQKLADELEKNPITIKQRAEEAAAILAQRNAAAAKIEDLKLDIEATRIIQKEIDELTLKLSALDAERENIKAAIAGKRYFIATEKSGIEGEARQYEAILLRTYDAAIDDAITYFRDKLDYLRSPGRITTRKVGGERNIFTDTIKLTEESNYQAINRALDFCRACIDELDTMKMKPTLDTARIEAMKKAIPDIDVFSEYTAEKPLPDSRGVNPLSFLPSSDTLALTMEKIEKKFKTVMRR